MTPYESLPPLPPQRPPLPSLNALDLKEYDELRRAMGKERAARMRMLIFTMSITALLLSLLAIFAVTRLITLERTNIAINNANSANLQGQINALELRLEEQSNTVHSWSAMQVVLTQRMAALSDRQIAVPRNLSLCVQSVSGGVAVLYCPLTQ